MQERRIEDVCLPVDLQHCPKLLELWANTNCIQSLQSVPVLSELRLLSIEQNELSNLNGLQALPQLRHLHVSVADLSLDCNELCTEGR